MQKRKFVIHKQKFIMAFSSVSVLFLIFIVSTSKAIPDTPCGDWAPYKEEKCLKIFNENLLTYADAENFCEDQNASNLISIGLEEKQDFVETFLKSNNIVDNVWIGLKYVNDSSTYEWSDGTPLRYTNWATGSPKNDSDYCVQIETEDTNLGDWADVLCIKKNLVICEKIQLWSQEYLQKTVMELEFEANQSQIVDAKLDSRISQLETTVSNLLKNSVPIGFIYVQLPKESPPKEIWPNMEWKDVSSDYAGVFFRTVGGDSAAFGEIQNDDSPRLVQMRVANQFGNSSSFVNVTPGTWTEFLDIDGNSERGTNWDMTVLVSSTEVRPRNMAVQIWKRIN